MTDLVFFYGTLMSGFQRPGRARLDRVLTPVGRGWIHAALFDLGIYPPPFPPPTAASGARCIACSTPTRVLSTLDEIEGFSISEPDTSLYTAKQIPVTFDDGRVGNAWVYFYNAPLGRAERIESGDYLEHLKVR